ncbi:MAG TPA: hypothetical protein VFB66_16490 [Tepidisphaeraceae bacterium]|nr:hypothetical protein [Tepidisphaeraceae bacterium]
MADRDEPEKLDYAPPPPRNNRLTVTRREWAALLFVLFAFAVFVLMAHWFPPRVNRIAGAPPKVLK